MPCSHHRHPPPGPSPSCNLKLRPYGTLPLHPLLSQPGKHHSALFLQITILSAAHQWGRILFVLSHVAYFTEHKVLNPASGFPSLWRPSNVPSDRQTAECAFLSESGFYSLHTRMAVRDTVTASAAWCHSSIHAKTLALLPIIGTK